jgi:predicted DNA-binding protein (MmcQ/YjbR family)
MSKDRAPVAKKMSPLLAKVRELALSYPETTEEFPWGDRVVKVKGKVFIFMGQDDGGAFGCSLKLPRSNALALELPFAEPTSYGLGKSGWVTLRGPELAKAPFDMLREFIDESFRAVAPAKVIAALDGKAAGKPVPAKKKPARPAKKK